MLHITFIAEANDQKLMEAEVAYERVWASHGASIITAYEAVTGFDFPVSTLHAVIHHDISQSNPLKFQAHTEDSYRIGDMIHELGHIAIVNGPTVKYIPDEADDELTRTHKVLYLILYDVLIQVMGRDFADWEIEREKHFSQPYATAWNWALAKDHQERQSMFRQLVKQTS